MSKHHTRSFNEAESYAWYFMTASHICFKTGTFGGNRLVPISFFFLLTETILRLSQLPYETINMT